jgi:predicted transposase YdaD
VADKPFDPTLKAMVEIGPADWVLLAGYAPDPVTILDSDLATVSRAADKVLRVAAASPYLIHLEFHAGHYSSSLPALLNMRSSLLEERHGLLVRTVAVILRPEADSPQLTGEYTRAFPGEAHYRYFKYDVKRVWQYPPERFLKGGLGTLPLAPISAVTEAELPGIIERMKQRLDRRSARRHSNSLWTATSILMGLRYSKETVNVLLRGVVSMRESVTYQAILEEGALAELKKILLLQGESSHLGRPSAAIRAAVGAINDLGRLEAMSVRLLQAENWQDLLQEPAAPPPPRRGPRRTNGDT